jgi:hypothetical protein
MHSLPSLCKNDEFLNKDLFEDNPFIVNNPFVVNNTYIVNNPSVVNKGLKRKYDESTCNDIAYDIPQIKIDYIEKYIEELSVYLSPSKMKYDVKWPLDTITPYNTPYGTRCTTPVKEYIQKIPDAPKKNNYIYMFPDNL